LEAGKNKIEMAKASKTEDEGHEAKTEIPSLSLESITEPSKNESQIPKCRFVEDINKFSNSFTPPASAELLIGAFSDLFGKFKQYEMNLAAKRANYQTKIPEIEKTLSLVRHLKQKKDKEEEVITRYCVTDIVYAKAEVDAESEKVYLWLGANVMLEYTYVEALELLSEREATAKKDFQEVQEDLSFTRDQIITAEVNISRIYNWDVRNKRQKREMEAAKK